MSLLRTGSLQSYLDATAEPGGFCLFLHIPKTAGSSLGHEIASHLKPYRNISVDYLDRNLPLPVKRQKAVDDLVAELKRDGRLRSASGHIVMKQAVQIKQDYPRTRIVTFLRDPVRRVVSDYRYQRTKAHPFHAEFIRNYPTIEDYVRADQSQNKMFRRLSIRPTDDVAAGIDLIERTLSFVGLVEMYPMSVNVMFRLFGEIVTPEKHVRKTEDTGENRVEDTPELRSLILDLNRSDTALYNHFRAVLEQREAEWESLGNAAPASREGRPEEALPAA